MVSKEYVVPLVVEGNGTPAAELRLIVKNRAKHAAHRQPQARAEVV